MANFARLTRAALYVSALTTQDWRENCDQSRTDRAVRIRPGAWYRRRLRKSFRYVGFGVWLRKECDGGSLGNGAALRVLTIIVEDPGDERGVHRFAGTEVRAGMIDQ